MLFSFFFFPAEGGIRCLVRSRGLGDVYKKQCQDGIVFLDFLHRAVVVTVPLRGDCFGLLDAEIVVVGGVVGIAAVPAVGGVVMIVLVWLWIGGLVKIVGGVIVADAVVVIGRLWNGKLAAWAVVERGVEIAAVTAAVGVIVWVVLWHLFLSMNRLSISTTFGRLLSFLEIVAIARVVVVDVGLIPTTGPPAVVTRVTKTILLIVIHEVSFENGGGVDGARRGDLKGQGGVSNNSCVCLLVVYRVYYGFDFYLSLIHI